MKNEMTLTLRIFPVLAHDHRTGKEAQITVTLTVEQLRAAGVVGQSSTELIERLCDRQGYSAIEIGKPVKRSITLDLKELLTWHDDRQQEKAKWNYLMYGDGGAN